MKNRKKMITRYKYFFVVICLISGGFYYSLNINDNTPSRKDVSYTRFIAKVGEDEDNTKYCLNISFDAPSNTRLGITACVYINK